MTSQTIALTLALGLFFTLGAMAGHYHGKSSVYETLFAKSDYMTINPITTERLK